MVFKATWEPAIECRGANGTELEAVAGKGKRAGTVTVARIHRQRRQGVNADIHDAFLFRALDLTFLDLLEDVSQLLANIGTYDGRRSLIGAKTMVVGGGSDGSAQQRAVLMQGAEGGSAEYQKLSIGMRGVTRIEQAAEFGISDRVVEMLAGTVDAGKGLFMQQAGHAIAFGHGAQSSHDQLVVVGGEVALLENRSNLKLARGNLVVTGFNRDAEFVELTFYIHHECQNTAWMTPKY